MNPFAGFIKVPFQFTTGFGVGAHNRVGESLNIEPLLPCAVNADWDLIARPSLNVTYAPGPRDFKTAAFNHSATPPFHEDHFFATASSCHSLIPPSRPSVLLTTLTLDGNLKLIVAALPPPM